MKRFLLDKVRLTHYFVLLFILYVLIVFFAPDMKFESGALTLFSVNSFLYGFYIAPILNAQKGRIEELHRIVRSEANAIFAMALGVKKLPKQPRNHIQDMFVRYIQSCIRAEKPGAGEEAYEALITYCLEYKGVYQSDIDKLLERLVANQQNRTNFSMQMSNKVFSNEWMIMIVLFSITLSFVLLLDAGGGYVYQVLAAMLCTGLTMLLIILVKMSTLTHKKARQIWDPYKKLINSHFYRID
jgi:multisubunit Na+/H+ antiporter MnhB subunit